MLALHFWPAAFCLAQNPASVTGGLGFLADGTRWEVAHRERDEARAALRRCRSGDSVVGNTDCGEREDLHSLGHQQPLGSAAAAREPLDEYNADSIKYRRLPTAHEFWERHVDGGR